MTCPHCHQTFPTVRRARKAKVSGCSDAMREDWGRVLREIREARGPKWYDPMTRRYLTHAAVKARDLARRKAAEADLAREHGTIPNQDAAEDAAVAALEAMA